MSDPQRAPLPQHAKPPAALVTLDAVTVRYGATTAVDDVTLAVAAGDIVGLVGANGAGKSTLMRVLSGMTAPGDGSLKIAGLAVPVGYGPRQAHLSGIRTVWQELSLCANLTVAENFYVEQPDIAGPVWRRSYAERARAALKATFPDARTDPDRLVGRLPIAERQMVEIARAASAPGLRLLILDEPTSSLDATASRQLRDRVRALAASGVAVIFITHKLTEIIDVANRAVVMRNGRKVADTDARSLTETELIAMMGAAEGAAAATPRDAAGEGRTLVRLGGSWIAGGGAPVALAAGSVVGVAGLEGSGQAQLLRSVLDGATDARRDGSAAFVSGDRARDGIFALFDVLTNISIGRITRRAALSRLSYSAEAAAARPLCDRVRLDPDRLGSPITDLSGGNQQKALVARALAADADILLLDDPTRGVDIATKQHLYGVIRETARSGKLVLWHSTEDREFAECDRVLVMSAGRVHSDLGPTETGEEAILAAAFHARATDAAPSGQRPGVAMAKTVAANALRNAAIVALVAILAVMMLRNPMVASEFGLRLLLGPAVALILVAYAQMFVVGGSQIDLGVGAFAGLVNVLAVTALYASPLLGLAAIGVALAGYAAMALGIVVARIPAIVVTLGASFIWYGTGYMILPAPGGTAPDWLRALTAWHIPGVPTPLILILLATAVAVAIHRSRTGTVLRGMGGNEAVMARSGWSVTRYTVLRYLIAGSFAATAGLSIAAASGAGDINAGGTYTLLSVAAVVLGGCQLLGGAIRPLGVAAGAVTLALIGALLGSLGVSTDYNAAVQGLLMIAVLGLGSVVIARGDG